MHEPAPLPVLSEHRLIRRLAMLVSELDLNVRDFVIFGSGPMLAHGLRHGIHDLDVVARGPAWQRVLEHGWISADWDADDLIERAQSIQGWPFAPLADVLAYKEILLRPKDYPDIAALHQAVPRPARTPVAAAKAR
jgi:hypothetical protein